MFRTTAKIVAIAAFNAYGAAAAVADPSPDQVLADARAKIAAATAKVRAAAKTPEEKVLVEVDLAFAADAKKRGAEEAFAAVTHPEGKSFPPRQPIAVGVEATRALFKGDTSLWEWAPVEALASGNVGVTWGIAAISGKDKDGKPFVITTRYVSVWRKDAAGAWKMWLDMGTQGPLPDVK